MSELPEAENIQPDPQPPVAPEAPAAAPPPPAPAVEAPAAEVPAAPAVADPEPVPAVRPRRQRPAVSDETLEAWQSTLAAERSAKERVQRAERQAAEQRRVRADAFRTLRRALDALDAPASADPVLQALAEDDLARQVHAAPEHVRAIVASTLSLLGSRRARR